MITRSKSATDGRLEAASEYGRPDSRYDTSREQRPYNSCLDSTKGGRNTAAIVRYIAIALSPSTRRFIHHGFHLQAGLPSAASGCVVHPCIFSSNNIFSDSEPGTAYSELK